MVTDIYCLTTGEYLEQIPPDMTILSERPSPKRRGDGSSDISLLVSTVRDLVEVISRHCDVSDEPDTFGVPEAARKLGCSPGFVRTLVKEGKLGHLWLGRKLRFRQEHIEQFWASQTAAGADKKKRTQRNTTVRADREGEATDRPAKNVKSAPVFPSAKEIKKLWQ